MQALDVDGVERTYLLTLPDDYDGTKPRPLVLSLHGVAGNKERHEATTALAEKGTARGYLVATPDALGDPQEWNVFRDEAREDDYGFFDARGRSFGRLGPQWYPRCSDPDRYAAAAMVSGFSPITCMVEDGAPSVIAFHGTADPVVPYDGGDSSGPASLPPALETLDSYADQYGCELPAIEEEPMPGVRLQSLRGCIHDSEVVLYTIVGGGHDWPGGATSGDAAEDHGQLSATDAILDFFDEHAR